MKRLSKVLSLLSRRISVASTPGPPAESNFTDFKKWTNSFWQKIEGSMASYEEFIGIRQVKEAHTRVLQAETDFMTAQEDRRQAQVLMNSMQVRLREVRTHLDRTPRGDNNYLELIKKEIELIRDERILRDTFEQEEKRERELFHSLSSALRFSHEKERAQTEKTKYWSILASFIGAFLGIVGTTINSQLKLRKLRQLMTENTEASAAAVIQKLEQVTSKSQLSDAILLEFKSLRKSVVGSDKQQNNNLFVNLERRFKAEDDKRRRDLLIVTLAISLIVPLLILKFSSS